EASALDSGPRAFLAALAERLPDGADGEALHTLIYEVIRERDAGSPAPYFTALYLALIGQAKGPRAGHFLAALPASFVRQRLRAAAAA
ncbi:MAG TPA: lysine--tRNA ligase, partial [Methylomirabilota bacterium]|nr:lysine--tRNA ligase [Methylomirabilota bacterium]